MMLFKRNTDNCVGVFFVPDFKKRLDDHSLLFTQTNKSIMEG